MRTLKQAADELGISKDRVKYWVKSRKITPVKVGKITYLTDEQFLDLQGFQVGKNGGEKPGNSPSNLPTAEDALIQQLAEKDKQIEALQQQLTDVHKLLDQEQKLHAMTANKLQLLEDKQKSEPQGFFARIFGRKREQP